MKLLQKFHTTSFETQCIRQRHGKLYDEESNSQLPIFNAV